MLSCTAGSVWESSSRDSHRAGHAADHGHHRALCYSSASSPCKCKCAVCMYVCMYDYAFSSGRIDDIMYICDTVLAPLRSCDGLRCVIGPM